VSWAAAGCEARAAVAAVTLLAALGGPIVHNARFASSQTPE